MRSNFAEVIQDESLDPSINFNGKDPFHQTNNRLNSFDRSFHDWYRFVLSFPPHLVRHYLKTFNLNKNAIILDPFCGTGTTLVEAKLNGFESFGIEANPIAHFASSVKTDWSISATELQATAEKIAQNTLARFVKDRLNDEAQISPLIEYSKLKTLDSDAYDLLLKDSISPLPLHKTLVLIEEINRFKTNLCINHLLLALAKALVFSISNLKFGPEVGVTKPKKDVPVVDSWLKNVSSMIADLCNLDGKDFPNSEVYLGDSRNICQYLKPKSIDAVITSPPYPNEKDYTRTTRLESVLLGFIKNKHQLREFKKTFVRSNTRNIYKGDTDSDWIKDNRDIQRIAEQIEDRRIELGKTSGFEKLYPAVTKNYFGGMTRHLHDLKEVLRPGAMLAYVVGDQASYLRVMIRTGKLLGDIAVTLGYELVNIDLFRTRFSTATGEKLREEVVVLQWKG